MRSFEFFGSFSLPLRYSGFTLLEAFLSYIEFPFAHIKRFFSCIKCLFAFLEKSFSFIKFGGFSETEHAHLKYVSVMSGLKCPTS